MKKMLTVSLIAVAMFLGQAAAANLDLEPCVNGDVSTSGLFNTENAETVAFEPCINGDV